MTKIKPGNYITFKAATRSHYKIATRKIMGVDYMGRALVRYHGYSDFIVLAHEIVSVDESKS